MGLFVCGVCMRCVCVCVCCMCVCVRVCVLDLFIFTQKYSKSKYDGGLILLFLYYISCIIHHEALYCYRLLQAKEPSGTYPEVDGFLRQCVREYEHTKECSVSINMIQTLSTIPIVSGVYNVTCVVVQANGATSLQCGT